MKILPLTLGSLLLAGACLSGAQQIQATVNGTPVLFADVQPMMIDQRVMVPLRGVFEHVGADVDWNEAMQMVTAKNADHTVVLHVGQREATVDGRKVMLETPAMKVRNRTLVPLRFIGESLGAKVAWIESDRLVAITTTDGSAEDQQANVGEAKILEINTVVPLRLMQPIASDTAQVGDKFSAALDVNGNADYYGLPQGTVVEGHVTDARAKTSGAPGVLGLDFDRVILPNGRSYAVDASLVGLDEKSVTNENGRLVAKDSKKGKDTLKWVGIGAGGGALVGLLTKGNVLTDALIGGALGWLFSEIQKNPSQSNNVALKAETPLGMRLDSKLIIRDARGR